MIRSLFEKYRILIEQAFLPIFVADDFDTETLLEGCRLANLSAIEYTLRRADAASTIPALKEKLPDIVLLVGSTLDADEVVEGLKVKHPQLLTLSELAPYADGFVSMLPYSDETLKKYSTTHLCIPTSETLGEALRQIKSGAAMIKVLGPDFSFAKKLHAAPTFRFAPTLLTGGVSEARLGEAYETGALVTAAGFDLILKGENPKAITAERVKERLLSFVSDAKAARANVLPAFKNVAQLTNEEFLQAFPNFFPIKFPV